MMKTEHQENKYYSSVFIDNESFNYGPFNTFIEALQKIESCFEKQEFDFFVKSYIYVLKDNKEHILLKQNLRFIGKKYE